MPILVIFCPCFKRIPQLCIGLYFIYQLGLNPCMGRFKSLGSIDLMCFIGTGILSWKNCIKHNYKLILVEVSYNKTQACQKSFSNRLILFKRGLGLKIHFKSKIPNCLSKSVKQRPPNYVRH